MVFRFPSGWQRRADAIRNIELHVLACHAPRQRPADPPVQLRPGGRLLGHDRGHDGDHVRPADLVDTLVHDGGAVPLQSTPPVLRPVALPRCRRVDPLARRAKRWEPRLPHCRHGIATAARQLTIREGCRACLSEPDVRIPAEPEVAALAIDGQPLHPVPTPAAGLHDDEQRPAVAVPSRSQHPDLLGSESSCHPDPP